MTDSAEHTELERTSIGVLRLLKEDMAERERAAERCGSKAGRAGRAGERSRGGAIDGDGAAVVQLDWRGAGGHSEAGRCVLLARPSTRSKLTPTQLPHVKRIFVAGLPTAE